jgi:ribonuclease P protein component
MKELQIGKRHEHDMLARAPSLAKFVRESAAMDDELRKRGASAVVMERLRQRAQFLAVAAGSKFPAAGFVLQARRRDDEGPARVGFTVSKKVGKAVERNRVRRRLREAVRLSGALRMHPGHDYVVVGRRAALTQDFARLMGDLEHTLIRLHDRPVRRSGRVQGPQSVSKDTP